MRIDSPGRRSQYLAALGIEQWVSRSTPRHPAIPVAQEEAAPRASAKSALSSRASAIATVTAPVVATAQAPLAADWAGLQTQVETCQRCPLYAGRTCAVFGAGRRDAEWMVVGEAPGSEEDKRGEPFVGAAGQLLTAMLAAIDLPREDVFITNILKCRPPENRDPKPNEVAQCLPYLWRQIEWVQPKIILAFGRIAAQNLLGVEQPLSRLRGQLHRVGQAQVPVIVTYHPAYLLRVPADKRKAWEDLKFARRSFNELPVSPVELGGPAKAGTRQKPE